MDFGTGCLKITPAHDINDYEIGIRHKLPVNDILDKWGKLNEKAVILVGEDRFAARKKIVKMLSEQGLLEKEESYTSQVGYSERTNAVIEPRLSLQWFMKMGDASVDALRYVEEEKIKLIPDKYRNTYRHWMENVKDWCISRQLWWGQRIPAWYLPDGTFVVAADEAEALSLAKKVNPELTLSDLNQDPDVLDTWFSSWLWPISVFDPTKPGFPAKEPNRDLAYYYPTNDLVTAPEILFFWVARMVMAGHEFCGDLPFRNVYLTGTVRDKQGRKMSKSLGNSPDPIELMKLYGADGVRVGMLLCSSAGTDVLFDESQVEQGRNFSNKIWNSYRLVKGWTADENAVTPLRSKTAVKWFDALLSQSIEIINDHFEKFRISDALMHLYKLFWDDYCAWYLEIVKPGMGESIDKATHEATIEFFDKLLRMLHPFMPFITEELWQNIADRKERESVMISNMPASKEYSAEFLAKAEQTKEVIAGIRSLRQAKNISPKEPLTLFMTENALPEDLHTFILKMANISEIFPLSARESDLNGSSFMVDTIELFLPVASFINKDEEIAKIDADIAHLTGFLSSVNKKLSNEKFVSSAPKNVVEMEFKKKSDAETKIEKLTAARLELLKG
jgi:valyl-tRNA synthetase